MGGAKPEQWLPRAPLYWLLAAQAALVLQHGLHLPLWLLLLWSGTLAYRLRTQRGGWRLLPRWFQGVAVAGGFVGAWLTFGTLGSLEATTTLLMTAVALKLLEAHTRRDAYLLLFLGYFSVLLGFLFTQTPLATGYALIPLVLLTAALLALHDGSRPRLIITQAVLLLVQSLPVMLVLFLLVPRLPPLWSVPQPGSLARTGLGATVAPGEVAQLSRSDRLAMRVRFAGEPPPHVNWYWRGIVLSSFDGRSWAMEADHSHRVTAANVQAGVEQHAGWTYQILQEPSHQPWRFSLAVPVATRGEVYLASDGRVAGPSKHERVMYTVFSIPDRPLDPDLSAAERARFLMLPDQHNPRARAWGKQLAQQMTPTERIQQVLMHFRQQPFIYTWQPPPLGHDSVDEFLFSTRRGFCEHYASSFAVVMRAAGVPARLVVGYQGGERNPLTGSILVHDYDAHAWVEVWLQGQGWVRVDPTAAVAPARVEQGLESALAGHFAPGSPLTAVRYREVGWINRLRLRMDAFEDHWALWVLHYRGERQWQTLTRLLGQVTVWRVGAILLMVGGLPLLMVALWQWRGQRRPADPQLAGYRKLCGRLSRAGYPPLPGEAPGAYLQRVAVSEPLWAESLQRIAQLFSALRYRPLSAPQRRQLQRALRRELLRFNMR